MRSTRLILAAICSLISFGAAHATECYGTGHRSTFGADSSAYFSVKSGETCNYAFSVDGVVRSTKVSASPKNGSVRMLNETSFEYKANPGYKGADSFKIETTGSNQTGSGTSVLTMNVTVN